MSASIQPHRLNVVWRRVHFSCGKSPLKLTNSVCWLTRRLDEGLKERRVQAFSPLSFSIQSDFGSAVREINCGSWLSRVPPLVALWGPRYFWRNSGQDGGWTSGFSIINATIRIIPPHILRGVFEVKFICFQRSLVKYIDAAGLLRLSRNLPVVVVYTAG